ncbi:MAG: prepilin-type N-terminal cleavage/methylation domain-containing protein, partial [Planctomycetota bacterium]|nr:prepilin-type N-terminal cleavage/methylation domain-containing protein [Planctomycetota bacterium]
MKKAFTLIELMIVIAIIAIIAAIAIPNLLE